MPTLDTVDLLQERIRRAPAALVAARIKRARKEFGSHDALAIVIDSSRQHLIKLEGAKHKPRAEMLIKIAHATGKSLDYFVDEEAGDAPFQEAA